MLKLQLKFFITRKQKHMDFPTLPKVNQRTRQDPFMDFSVVHPPLSQPDPLQGASVSSTGGPVLRKKLFDQNVSDRIHPVALQNIQGNVAIHRRLT
jgi:hypothetical protein